MSAERRAGSAQALLLLFGSCLPVLGAVLIAPLLPRMQAHFADTPGAAVLVPVALTLPALVIAFLAPLAGVLADRIGRVQTLLITIITYAVFTVACGFAPNFETLLVFRALQGLGFGGEWAVGSVLIAETISARHRGKASGLVQSSWAVGWGAAVLVSVALFTWLPPELSWRLMFFLGVLPAFLIIYIRRSIQDPEVYVQTRRGVESGQGSAHFLDIFKPAILPRTVLASLLFTGMQGGYYAIGVWLPTFLKNERQLTVLGSGGYQFMFIAGAFLGYLCGAYLSDRLGRRLAFILFAIGAGTLVYAYTLLPITDGLMLVLGFPLGFFMSGIFSGAGAFLAELFPNEAPPRRARDNFFV